MVVLYLGRFPFQGWRYSQCSGALRGSALVLPFVTYTLYD